MAMKLGNDVVLDEITAAVERGAQAAAERARRRDMFAAAALTGLMACPNTSDGRRRRAFGGYEVFADEAVRHADALLAALDATAGPQSREAGPASEGVQPPASASVPLPPMRYDRLYGSESDPMRVTTSTGTQLIGRCVQRRGWDPLWVTMDNVIIHGVIGWEPIDVPTAPVSRPPETRQTQRGGA